MKIKNWFQNSILPALVLAAPFQALAVGLTGDNFDFAGDADSDLITAIENIINWGLMLAALVAAIFLIIGGIQYITSQGDDTKAETAKNTILFAVIGLIVIGLAAAIVRFVIQAINVA
ncbi:MAG: hypothetical protein WD200_01760 [Candidatus Andersenbacteria bacterium]